MLLIFMSLTPILMTVSANLDVVHSTRSVISLS